MRAVFLREFPACLLAATRSARLTYLKSDDSLSVEVKATFERHLTACANCVRYLESYRTTTKVCKKAFEAGERDGVTPVPEELIQAILAARPKAEG